MTNPAPTRPLTAAQQRLLDEIRDAGGSLLVEPRRFGTVQRLRYRGLVEIVADPAIDWRIRREWRVALVKPA